MRDPVLGQVYIDLLMQAAAAVSKTEGTQHMTTYCYDTEFLEDGTTVELISIGIVASDGREYYAVNSDMDVDRIKKDDWLMKNVVPQLPSRGKTYQMDGTGPWIWSLDTSSTSVKPKWVIANEVREFLLAGTCVTEVSKWGGDLAATLQDPKPQVHLWAYYGAYDHIALMQLWGKMIQKPEHIPMWTHDLMQLIETLPSTFVKPKQTAGVHNALEDARWNWEVLKAAATALEGKAERHSVAEHRIVAAMARDIAVARGYRSDFNGLSINTQQECTDIARKMFELGWGDR